MHKRCVFSKEDERIMATTKKTASEAAKEILAAGEKKVNEAAAEVKKATETVSAVAKKVADSATKKAADTKKKATETAAAAKKKTTAAKKSAATATKKASTTAKKTVAAAKGEVVETAILQFGGNDYKVDDIIAKATASFKVENKNKTIKDIKVYIKPEDNAAYYVVNNDCAGRVDL